MTLSRKCQELSNSTLNADGTNAGVFAIEQSGNVIHDADWRVLDTLWKGLRTLCGKGSALGRAVYARISWGRRTAGA